MPSRYCQMLLAATKCARGEFNSGISRVPFSTWYDFGGPDLAAPAEGAGQEASPSHPSCAPF